MSTWIVTPVYRDVRSFTILRQRLLEVLGEEPAPAGGPVRFVVIDDTAGQDPEIDSLRGLEGVTILQPPFNLGHQRALVYALRKMLPQIADSDAVVTLDAGIARTIVVERPSKCLPVELLRPTSCWRRVFRRCRRRHDRRLAAPSYHRTA